MLLCRCVGWPISNPVELFEKYLGVHLAVDDRGAINANVVSWSCHIIKVGPYLCVWFHIVACHLVHACAAVDIRL